MARCLLACCEANRRRPVFPLFTSAFGPGLHVLSGGVGDGRTPVAVFPGGEWMVPGRAARSADAGPVFGKAPGPRQSTPSPATPPGTPSSAPASSTPSAPLRGHERPRQDHGPGNSGLPRGETCAPGGGSGQPCREWTKGSHSPGSRRAARRCSSRDRGDWPGPAGRACTGGRRPERRRAAPAQRGRAPARGERGTGTRTGRRRQPPGHTLLLSRRPRAG